MRDTKNVLWDPVQRFKTGFMFYGLRCPTATGVALDRLRKLQK